LGQKVHPVGFRLGISKEWQAKWYADKQYTEFVLEDLRIRKAIASKYAADDVSRVEIERSANQITVTINTARPGIVIGRGGQRVDETRLLLEKTSGKRVRLNIVEIAQPEIDAYLVARSIAQQMERRISHRRGMKQAISRAMERGAQGIKIQCSGRLSNSEYARQETMHQGRVPLHTLRADIDYALAEAHTTLGRIGVKVWVYKGDIIPESEKPPIESSLLMPHVAHAEPAVGAVVKDEVREKTEVGAELSAPAEIKAKQKVEESAQLRPSESELKVEVIVDDGTKVPGESKAKARPKLKAKAEAKDKDKEKAKSKTVKATKEKEKPKVRSKPKEKAKVEEKPKLKAKEHKKAKAKAKSEAEPEPKVRKEKEK
jgi:small subunit ribosomal protein S3